MSNGGEGSGEVGGERSGEGRREAGGESGAASTAASLADVTAADHAETAGGAIWVRGRPGGRSPSMSAPAGDGRPTSRLARCSPGCPLFWGDRLGTGHHLSTCLRAAPPIWSRSRESRRAQPKGNSGGGGASAPETPARPDHLHGPPATDAYSSGLRNPGREYDRTRG